MGTTESVTYRHHGALLLQALRKGVPDRSDRGKSFLLRWILFPQQDSPNLEALMAKTPKELLKHFRPPHYEPYLRKIRGTYLFQINNVGDLRVSVEYGEITVDEGKSEADCVFRCTEPDLIDILEGRRNLLTAILQGRVEVHGDAALAQKVNGLVRARAHEKDQQQRGAA